MEFPTSLATIDAWAKARGIPLRETRHRFVSFLILECIAANPTLKPALAFKGGNALRFAYKGRRSTLDLDFTADSRIVPDSEAAMRTLMNEALAISHRRFAVKLKCQKVRRNPPGAEATRPTYAINVGFQFPTDRYYADFEDRNVSTTVTIEISFNDLVCETILHPLDDEESRHVRVCSLEDIFAEKLRSLLQQPIRNRNRAQDVYDIAAALRDPSASIDKGKVSRFLIDKAAAREIQACKSAFDGTVRSMAEHNYEIEIRRQAADEFIPFDDAWEAVRQLVDSLSIPDDRP